MAFDGPGPFDGDACAFLQIELEEAPEDAEAIIEDMLAGAIEMPYVEVDEGVWAWIAAELVAHHCGREPERPLPSAFTDVPVKDVSDLVPLAKESLGVIADLERSELAQLWSEGNPDPFAQRLEELQTRLASVELPADG